MTGPSRTDGAWPAWLLVTVLVLAALVLVPLLGMLCMMAFGGGMMGGGMMGMPWLGGLGMALVAGLLVVLIVLIVRRLTVSRAERPTNRPPDE